MSDEFHLKNLFLMEADLSLDKTFFSIYFY